MHGIHAILQKSQWLTPQVRVFYASVTSSTCMPSAHSGATSAGVSSCVGTADSKWRNRDEFFEGRDAIKAFLTRKWEKELQYKLMKELWCYQGNRISVRFEYEYHDHSGQWWRAHGNEVCLMLLVAEMACMLAHEDSLCA